MVSPLSLRRDVATLSSDAARELNGLWGRSAIEEVLRDTLPGLVDLYGAAAATVAADWYDDLRDERAIRGRFTAIPADIPDTGTQELVGWALSEARDPTTLQTLVVGGVQRRIANFARRTVMGSSTADPSARGWQRTGAGECDFCQMLLGRGAVYSEATADFEAHDHCNCGAEPAW